jgi:hypothetical protein
LMIASKHRSRALHNPRCCSRKNETACSCATTPGPRPIDFASRKRETNTCDGCEKQTPHYQYFMLGNSRMLSPLTHTATEANREVSLKAAERAHGTEWSVCLARDGWTRNRRCMHDHAAIPDSNSVLTTLLPAVCEVAI